MEITPAIVSAFRVDFDGFADVAAWPDNKVTRALEIADKETGSGRWGEYSDLSIKQRGMFYYTAHHLATSKINGSVTASGGTPSAVSQVQSKSVGDESITYAVNTQKAGLDGGLDSTAYGQEFIRLRRRVGRGGSSSNAGSL